MADVANKSTHDDQVIRELAIVEGEKLPDFVSDPHAPSLIPRERVTLGLSWLKKPMQAEMTYDLGKLSFIQGLMSKVKGVSELVDPEIHVIWSSYCPADIYQNPMSVSLEFTKSTDEHYKLIGRHQSPMNIPAHHIFYPKQTITIGVGATIPWAISVNIRDLKVASDYHVGKLQIYLRGYVAGGTNYTSGESSELIFLSPPDDAPSQGLRVSRPRRFGDKWELGGYKIGSLSKEDATKLRLLQSCGVDVEGIMMLGKTKAVLKALHGYVPAELTLDGKLSTALLLVKKALA